MRRFISPIAVLSWLSLAEWKIFERLLWVRSGDHEFVLSNVQGILAGRPVSKSWQHRLVGPWAVSALTALTRDPRLALHLFLGLMLLAANFLLFALMRRRGASFSNAMLAVVCFGFTHLLFAYHLEYPWDGIDVLLFFAFGYWAARGRELLRLAPLLLLGVVNHETVFYIPLWYLLAPLDGWEKSAVAKKRLAVAALAAAILAGITYILRDRLYLGQPDLPGQDFERSMPVVENHWHVSHNVSQLFVNNWVRDKAHISIAFLAALAWLVVLTRRAATRRAAVWTLCVIGSIVCFGYINETRHYLALFAFWFAYAWPARSDERVDVAS